MITPILSICMLPPTILTSLFAPIPPLSCLYSILSMCLEMKLMMTWSGLGTKPSKPRWATGGEAKSVSATPRRIWNRRKTTSGSSSWCRTAVGSDWCMPRPTLGWERLTSSVSASWWQSIWLGNVGIAPRGGVMLHFHWTSDLSSLSILSSFISIHFSLSHADCIRLPRSLYLVLSPYHPNCWSPLVLSSGCLLIILSVSSFLSCTIHQPTKRWYCRPRTMSPLPCHFICSRSSSSI